MNKLIIRLSFFAVILIQTLTSCHPFSCSWDRGYEQLTELQSKDSIIGVYKLTSTSKEYLQNKGFENECLLTILDSDKFELKNIPDFLLDMYGETKGKSVDRTGGWFLSCGDSYGCMFELEGIQVMPIAKKDNGRISFLMTIGDGDECNGIIFEKK